MITQLNHIAHIWWQWMSGMFWQVGLLIILVTIIDRAIRSWAWPQVRYVLWGLVFLKLVIPPTWQMNTSVVSWVQPMFEKHISIQVETDDRLSGALLETGLTFLSGESTEGTEAVRQATWRTGLFLAWLGGMVAFAAALFGKLSRLRKWQRRQNDSNAADSEIPCWFHELLTETARQLKLKRAPAVVFSEDAASPAVFGLVRPTILLPEGYLGGLSREEAEHVLIHELCHLKRGDLLIHWLCLLIQIFYWFNPLLIWTRRQMRHVCEICCDLSVAEILREKTRHYRDTLLKNARELFTETVEPSLGLLGLFEEPFRIVSRLRWLERETWGHRKRKFATALATSLIMVVFVMPMAGISQPENQDSEYTLTPVSVSAKRIVPLTEEARAALEESQLRLEADPDDYAAARQPLIDFLETHPRDSVPLQMYQMLAQLCYIDRTNDGYLEDANKIYKMAFEAFPDNDQVLLNYAVTTYELQRFEEAAVLFEKYYGLNKNSETKFLEFAAGAYYAGGNQAEAKRVYSLLIDSVDPPEAKWLDVVISLCQQTGDLESAEYYIHQAMDFYPTEEKYQQMLDRNNFLQENGKDGSAPADASGGFSEGATDAEQGQDDTSPNEDRVYNLNEVDTKPRVLRAVAPVYPLEAKENRITGRVVVELTVTRDGVASDEWIIEAEPPDVFEDAALEAVRQYRFSPATRNGEPVDVLVKLPVSFALDGSKTDARAPENSANGGDADMALSLSEVDTPPQVLKAVPPQYPFIAKRDNIEGRVVLRFLVDTDGKAKEPEAVEVEPELPELLAEQENVFVTAALKAIEQYEFKPAIMNGKPVACIVKIPIVFELTDEKPEE